MFSFSLHLALDISCELAGITFCLPYCIFIKYLGGQSFCLSAPLMGTGKSDTSEAEC